MINGLRMHFKMMQTIGVKAGDIFESKGKLIQAINDWSIKHVVSCKPVKSNTLAYIIICEWYKGQDGVEPSPYKLQASFAKMFE